MYFWPISGQENIFLEFLTFFLVAKYSENKMRNIANFGALKENFSKKMKFFFSKNYLSVRDADHERA
jgi:ABC-type polysaccharide/polyol phosphate transport system ATPase subunit